MSTSGAEVVEPIGELLGADRVVATRMVVGEDGCFTGEVEYYAYGPTKADAIKDLAASEGYDLSRCYAYSDSATDVPMLESVGHPHAVNPDRTLRREAVARSWPILDFHRPVRLKQRLPNLSVPPRPALVAAAAIGAAAATAGLVWYASRLARLRGLIRTPTGGRERLARDRIASRAGPCERRHARAGNTRAPFSHPLNLKVKNCGQGFRFLRTRSTKGLTARETKDIREDHL